MIAVSACGGRQASTCVEIREPEDPASTRHVLTDGAYSYLTDPPTSGPHVAGPVPSGVIDHQVARPVQVRLLEAGGVMIQFDLDRLGGPVPSGLTGLADETTVVAPGLGIDDAIVATAWTWKLSCSDVDEDRIARFAAERRTAAPGLD